MPWLDSHFLETILHNGKGVFGEESTVYGTYTQRRSVMGAQKRSKPNCVYVYVSMCVVGEGREIIAMDGFSEELIFKLSFREK